jgi:cytochrome c peroxidase
VKGVLTAISGVALCVAVFVGFHTLLGADETRPVPGITTEMVDALPILPGELGPLPAPPVPANDRHVALEIELGKKLFFDTRLSMDRKTSCASCHAPEKAYTDGLALSKGFGGAFLSRNAPTILNAAYNTTQFWDGRSASLDEQCKIPLMAGDEMHMIDEQHLIERLSGIPGYVRDFQQAYDAEPSLDFVAKSIAAFERTLVTPDSAFDRYAKGDKHALTDREKRGLILFFGKAACSECHKGSNFTDNQFHNLGATPSKEHPDLGRFEITKKEEDRGAFKTPSLRNVALTAPYMHDGSSKTLEEVIDFYDRGGGDDTRKSKLIYKLNLSPEEKADLLAFMKALTGRMPNFEMPATYPEVGVSAANVH